MNVARNSARPRHASRPWWANALLLSAAVALALWSIRVAQNHRRAWHLALTERAHLEQKLAAQSAARRPQPSTAPLVPAAPIPERPKVNVTEFELADQSAGLRLGRAIDEEQYGPFFRKMALRPEERTALLAARARYREETVSIDAAMKSEGRSVDDPTATALKQITEDRLHAAERALLGDDRYLGLQDYERTSWIRDRIIWRVAGNLVFTDEPLRDEQGDRLLRIVDAASSDPKTSGGARPVDWPTVMDQAHQFLSSRQLARLSAVVNERRRGELISRVRPLIAEPPPDLPP